MFVNTFNEIPIHRLLCHDVPYAVDEGTQRNTESMRHIIIIQMFRYISTIIVRTRLIQHNLIYSPDGT